MYATQEFYSFSLILPVFVLPSKYIAEEEGAGGQLYRTKARKTIVKTRSKSR